MSDAAHGAALASLSLQQLLRGEATADPEPIELHAGPLTAELRGIEITYIRLGDREIVRRIFQSVRDENWETVLPTVADVEVMQEEDRFAVAFSARNDDGIVAFSWHGRIEGGSDSNLTYTMQGRAERAFRYCRIGFCLLHAPEEYAGRPYRIASSGSSATGVLPVEIAPQFFRDGVYLPTVPVFSQLEVELDGGISVHFDLTGDLFEIEDQRNWTDASFKTYCTPASLGFPFDATAGQRFEQRVALSLLGAAPVKRRPRASVVEVELGEPLGHGLPRLGTTFAPSEARLSPREVRVLGGLELRHLRVDVHLARDDAEATLRQAAVAAGAIGARLEIALFASDETAARSGALLREAAVTPGLDRVLVFSDADEVTPASLVRAVRQSLGAASLTAPVGGGTDLWFAEVNRDPPEASVLDFLSFSITPQVHAFDDASLVETLAVQAEAVRTARTLAPGLPIVVSSVTLKPRNSAVTTDPRQRALFGAAWTVGSLRYLTEAGVSAATFYEATGPRGIVETDDGSPATAGLPSLPGIVYPVYHVFAAAGAFAAGTALTTDTSDPRRLEVLAVAKNNTTHALAANMESKPLRARLKATGAATASASILVLDPASARGALVDPAFTDPPATRQLSGGVLDLELGPYGVAFVRIPASRPAS